MRRRGPIIPLPAADGHLERRDDEEGLIEVHRCEQAEALVMKSLFESEGIPTLLRSALISSLHPFSVGVQGQVAVSRPRERALALSPPDDSRGPPATVADAG